MAAALTSRLAPRSHRECRLSVWPERTKNLRRGYTGKQSPGIVSTDIKDIHAGQKAA